MTIIRALVQFDSTTGLPEDLVTNTFHFSGVADAGNATDITDALQDFYDTDTGGANTSIADYLSPTLFGTATVKLYDLADAEPRVPFSSQIFSIGGRGGTPLPEEVAICCSFEGVHLSGANQARRRGRVFLGPVSTSSYGAGTPTRPSTAVRSAIAIAAERLRDDATSAGVPWHVYSPSNSTSVPVVSGWVDNAFDTMRSRGPRPTARTTWS